MTREKLIEIGLIIPAEKEYGNYNRPPMTKECLESYRDRLIKAGILKPSLRH
jgi:hypothetical protein